MPDSLIKKDEKKVEYLELIYDLVFVYMVGRNNSLLNSFENGFFSGAAFMAFVISTLTIIQIWHFTTYYINMFGRNGLRDHVFLLTNMYLIYFIGQSTRSDWMAYQAQYHIAWALIVVNIGMQYVIEMRNHKGDAACCRMLKSMALRLFIVAAIALAAGFVSPEMTGAVSMLAILAGIIMTAVSRNKGPEGIVDFMHLTERAMLYVVFTFGEMIIVLSAYFVSDGGFDLNVIYFSLMGFLIVAGLFVSYELVYDHLIDRELNDSGMLYMMIHIFIIFALSCITVSLEFMREEEVALLPKTAFITAAMIAYYVFLFSTRSYAKKKCGMDMRFLLKMIAASIAFAVLMLVFRENMSLNIFISAVYVWGTAAVLYRIMKDDKHLV